LSIGDVGEKQAVPNGDFSQRDGVKLEGTGVKTSIGYDVHCFWCTAWNSMIELVLAAPTLCKIITISVF
jgi:hypothetical protein